MHHQQNLSQTLASAFANPYAQYSSHYVQALARAAHPPTTPDGYTLSSTYTTTERQRPQTPAPKPNQHRSAAAQSRQSSSWYQPGNHRCTYHGCNFYGSQKSVELHMMDRHLIHPPGWETRKMRPEWDADPSLKGKPIPIHGTGVVLDTPAALEAWFVERKKRYPSTQRIVEKKRKLDEAIERGQIIPQDTPFPRKRHRGQQQTVGKGNFRSGRKHGKKQLESINAVAKSVEEKRPRDDLVSSGDSDEAPEIASSKVPSTIDRPRATHPDRSNRRTSRPVPKKTPHNPFAARSSLLHSLLLPEIRMTISNLSQAIRFLVDNEFLTGVELTPGEAENKMIQVLD
ncbi:hypothetical protein APHAL10511_006310 [Amanita phalloides]|nr:hypothetical protein APHAL10511_006310 [Amanita phalloides]